MRLAILLLLTVLSGPAFAGKVFACKDAKGATSFQHTPCAAVGEQQRTYTFKQPAAPQSSFEYAGEGIPAGAVVVGEAPASVPAPEAIPTAPPTGQRVALPARGANTETDDCVRDRFTPAGACLDRFGERAERDKQLARMLGDEVKEHRRSVREAIVDGLARDAAAFDPNAKVRDHRGIQLPHAIQVAPGVVFDNKSGKYSYGGTANADGSVTLQPD